MPLASVNVPPHPSVKMHVLSTGKMHDLKVLLYVLPTVPEVVPATSVDESVLPANNPANIFTVG